MKQIITILALAIISSFAQAQNPNLTKIVVEEVLQTSNYTYLLNKTDNGSQWVATMKVDAKVGDIFYYMDGMEMDEELTEIRREADDLADKAISIEKKLLKIVKNTIRKTLPTSFHSFHASSG